MHVCVCACKRVCFLMRVGCSYVSTCVFVYASVCVCFLGYVWYSCELMRVRAHLRSCVCQGCGGAKMHAHAHFCGRRACPKPLSGAAHAPLALPLWGAKAVGTWPFASGGSPRLEVPHARSLCTLCTLCRWQGRWCVWRGRWLKREEGALASHSLWRGA